MLIHVSSYFIHPLRNAPSNKLHCPKSQEISAVPVASLNILSFFRKSLNVGFSEQQQRGNYRAQLHKHRAAVLLSTTNPQGENSCTSEGRTKGGEEVPLVLLDKDHCRQLI